MNLKDSLLLCITTLAILLFSSCSNDTKLPILGPREAVEVKNPDGSTTVDTLYKTIPAFTFLNQDSTIISNDTFKDKIYIADFFFTSCSSICPTMHRHMKEVFDEYKDNDQVMFLSHTIDYKYDKPSVLKKYASKLGVDGKQWQFAYGAKDSIYKIAEKDYLVAVIEDSTEKENYVHQGWLMLVDKRKRLRGAYEGTDEKSVAQLKKDIAILLNEKEDSK